MRRFGCWLCYLRHLEHPILKALLQVLKRQTNEHFYLCYLHAIPEKEPYLPPAFMEFIIIKYEIITTTIHTHCLQGAEGCSSMSWSKEGIK
jgi:hypothetical protein